MLKLDLDESRLVGLVVEAKASSCQTPSIRWTEAEAVIKVKVLLLPFLGQYVEYA